MKKHIIILLFHICLLPKMLWAQNDSAKTLYWLKLSAGIAGAGLATGADFHLAPAGKCVFYGVHSLFSEGFLTVEKANTVAATAGFFRNGKYGFVSVSAGLGPVWGIKEGKLLFPGLLWDKYEKVPYITAGIPIQAEFRLDPIKYAGIGLTLTGNLNNKFPHFGCMISLNLGRLKP